MNQSLFLVLFGLVALSLSVNAVGRQQAASARGVLMCKGKPASGLNVRLFDHDTFTPDDKMASVTSSGDGSFSISGHKSEVGSVRPDVKIYHKCGSIFTSCHKIRIPSEYVVWGSGAQKTYDVGTIQLESTKNNC